MIPAPSRSLRKPAFAGSLLVLLLGVEPAHSKAPVVSLKEEAVFIEFCPARNEATLRVEAESEGALERVELRSPANALVLKLLAEGHTALALSGFEIETREQSLGALLQAYPEGTYAFRALGVSGRPMRGHADLSHLLLDEPVITHPLDGATSVPSQGLVVSWTVDLEADGYEVRLELDENDGLTVKLPRGSGSFPVPDGFLPPAAEVHFELTAIARNRNRTLAEADFTTQ